MNKNVILIIRIIIISLCIIILIFVTVSYILIPFIIALISWLIIKITLNKEPSDIKEDRKIFK